MNDGKIDRYTLVKRHNPTIRGLEPLSPLSVGNGEFAFTADITGLQSFPEHYEIPLGTQSQWGWHSSGGKDRYRLQDIRKTKYGISECEAGYAVDDKGQEDAFHWLRQNPHRLQLGQIGLNIYTENFHTAEIDDLHNINQTLDMWTGMLTSQFHIEGISVHVQTCCHPERDQLAVKIESPLLAKRRLEVTVGFPSSQPNSRIWDEAIGLNWQEDSHYTELVMVSETAGEFRRTLDQDAYCVTATWSGGEIVRVANHRYRLIPENKSDTFEFTLKFAPNGTSALDSIEHIGFQEIAEASARHWDSFWSEGGAIELAESQDPRAIELERRIVLSQYLTAIHCAGSLPPQETGLLYNTWFGKFHLEMHWWHAVHFALWGRTHLLRKSLGWYADILPAARELARSQGYKGARWPKMVGPEGVDSPSPIGPLLVWQQPHPIVFAELCYLSEPTMQTLEQFKAIVMETAHFMASFPTWDAEHGRYVLGPPIIPAQEEHQPETTWNPTFELEYWRHGLELAQTWRKRLGMEPVSRWQHICDHLSPLPQANGVYIAHENCPETHSNVNVDHPSMLGALGMLPGRSVDQETMRRTLYTVMREWRWETAWGWDFPMAAMTAARLGEGHLAVDFLMMDASKNTYLPNGHNYQRKGLTAYLPGNGGLLTAIAIMACGWQGCTELHAPGFPDDSTWIVRHEGLKAWL